MGSENSYLWFDFHIHFRVYQFKGLMHFRLWRLVKEVRSLEPHSIHELRCRYRPGGQISWVLL